MTGASSGEEITGQDRPSPQLAKRMVERATQVKLTDLGYELHQEPSGAVGNTRDRSTPKSC